MIDALGPAILLLAAAGDGAPVAERLRELIHDGRAADAARFLEDGARQEALLADPGALTEACLAAARCADHLAAAGSTESIRVVESLMAMAEKRLAAADGDPPALRARSFAILAWQRLQAGSKTAATADGFVAAADGFERAYGRSPGNGADLVAAAEALSEAASCPDAEAAALWSRAEALVERVRAKHSRDPAVVAGAALVLVARVRWGAARREPGLEERLERALAFLAEAQKAVPDDAPLASAQNEIAFLVVDLGLKRPVVPVKSRTVEFPNGLVLDLPAGRSWTGPEPGKSEIVQWDRRAHMARTIAVHDYRWSSEWTLPDGSRTRGDAIKSIADEYFADTCRALKGSKTRRPPGRGGLRQCEPGWVFEVDGTGKDGRFARRRAWYFKSREGNLTTYELFVNDGCEGLPEDPALKFVLDSVREKPR